MKTKIVYLLHFEKPYCHAKHYIGSTSNLIHRMKEHDKGKSDVRLLNVIRENNIGFYLARVWRGDKIEERRLKNRGGASRHCPICKGKVDLEKKKTYGLRTEEDGQDSYGCC